MGYINKEALFDDIEESVVFTTRPGIVSSELRGANKIIDRIKRAPAADVAEVVRCKDCRYCVDEMCECYQWRDANYAHFVREDDFCSYGERKGEGE